MPAVAREPPRRVALWYQTAQRDVLASLAAHFALRIPHFALPSGVFGLHVGGRFARFLALWRPAERLCMRSPFGDRMIGYSEP